MKTKITEVAFGTLLLAAICLAADGSWLKHVPDADLSLIHI